jgi:hypothetical protein
MFFPMFAMFMLTVVLAFAAVKARIASVKNGEMKISYFSLMSGEALSENVAKTTRSFNNQFEVPTLFYVIATLHMIMGLDDLAAQALAWLFVLLRYVHAYIHLGSNNVKLRMLIFFSGLLVLVALWLHAALSAI